MCARQPPRSDQPSVNPRLNSFEKVLQHADAPRVEGCRLRLYVHHDVRTKILYVQFLNAIGGCFRQKDDKQEILLLKGGIAIRG
jgi:hypothetical protein